MRDFANLFEKLVLTQSRNRKIELLTDYLRHTPDPDRGYTLAVLTGELSFKNVKAGKLKEVVLAHVDPNLFAMSYDYVGDLGETIALLWPFHNDDTPLPSLSTVIDQLNILKGSELTGYIESLLTAGLPHERWALVKLVTGALRIGVSTRTAKTALAALSGQDIQHIEEIWHGMQPPYRDLFDWLEGKREKPVISAAQTFHPLMLSTPIDEEKDFQKLDPMNFNAEWKWDGIRVQLVAGDNERRLYSRTGDDISKAFPDIIDNAKGSAVLDGELLVGPDFTPLAFNDLQQRLNRKVASPAHLKAFPVFIRLYDMLFDGDEDIRPLALSERRARLEQWIARNPQTHMDISPIIPFLSWDELGAIRNKGAEEKGHEGVMIKHRDSPYVPGRPVGLWYKWKRDPRLVDAILMYAQRGHGKRSSYYSDYTFGVWKGNEIVPIGKAYFGFTDEELKQLDKWVRTHTIERFGPVCEVQKELVFEVAFDSAQISSRHKSGIALRFPRINRIRWDKPAQEADTLETMTRFVA
ncbi:MAG TPA: cisplatin damage response ATP-dependent DNA ligase [Alphaproteobacteria bacterium]